MIYRGPDFLAVVRFGSSPTPSSEQVVFLFQSSCVSLVELIDGRGLGGKGVGEESKSYVREKAWPSINHSILPDATVSTL
jgi:hypothetical protein